MVELKACQRVGALTSLVIVVRPLSDIAKELQLCPGCYYLRVVWRFLAGECQFGQLSPN